MKFSIITPTTGNKSLLNLIDSINNLTVSNDFSIEHIIVVDGKYFWEKTDNLLNKIRPEKNHERYVIHLPFNTGANNFLGHKIYASITQIINGDYVIYLDEDNWFDKDHVLNYYNLIKSNNLDWCFCLRKIISENNEFICNDDCESLGNLSPTFYNNESYLIDTSCYCVSKNIAIKLSYIWNSVGTDNDSNPDRVFAKTLLNNYPKYNCTFKYTLNYRVSNRLNSVKDNLFLQGNQIFNKIYEIIPWNLGNSIYIIHFNKDNTDKIIKRIYSKNKSSISYNQWQLNILDKLDNRLVLSGYNKFIPSGSKVLIHLCNLNDLPIDLLQRNDIEKILYTIESPNIRHQQQWNLNFIKYFDKVITYWIPLIRDIGSKAIFFPFIHRFDFFNINDTNNIIENNNYEKKICIVLENRSFNNEYIINGIKLKSLDYLRWQYAKNLGKQIYCYGNSWNNHSDIINYCPTINRFLDKEYVIDIMKNYTFCLIIENCDADGYVSEKIYDALTVGTIPLYYGNNNKYINIPQDCYIDLKNISPEKLPEFINSLTEETIQQYKKNIYEKRLTILQKVSVNLYNHLINIL